MMGVSLRSVLVASLILGGCASRAPERVVHSSDSDLLFIGEEAPADYPKSYVTKNGPSCENVTESWQKDKEQSSGKTMWLKVVERKIVNCE